MNSRSHQDRWFGPIKPFLNRHAAEERGHDDHDHEQRLQAELKPAGHLSIITSAQQKARARRGNNAWHVGKWDLFGQPTDCGYEATDRLFAGGSRLPQGYPHDFAGRPTTGYYGWIFRTGDGKTMRELFVNG